MQDKAYIDGQWVGAHDGKTFKVYNPSNGQELGSVPDMEEEETLKAIGAARKALDSWRLTTAKASSWVTGFLIF